MASSVDKTEGTSDEEFSGSAIKDYLTMPEVVRAIDMSRPAVLRLIKTEKLLHYRVGNKIRVKKTEVRRFLEQGNHPNSKSQKD